MYIKSRKKMILFIYYWCSNLQVQSSGILIYTCSWRNVLLIIEDTKTSFITYPHTERLFCFVAMWTYKLCKRKERNKRITSFLCNVWIVYPGFDTWAFFFFSYACHHSCQNDREVGRKAGNRQCVYMYIYIYESI